MNLYVEVRRQWRDWLEANSATATEVWLVYYKKETGRPCVDYGEAVEEALCFGWIDSKIKNLDESRFVRLFTPRKPGSHWSASNIERAERMIREGKMNPAGLRVYDPTKKTPEHPTQLPPALEAQFRKEEKAWAHFQQFTPAYQRMTIGWVASAKQEATKLRRLRQLITESAANRRIKFM